MNLHQARSVFFIGIGGSGMSGLAYLISQHGKDVSGCDQDDTTRLPSPLRLVPEDKALEAIEAADVVIYSDAVLPTNPYRAHAESTHIITIPYQEAVGEFAKEFTVIAITGAHGKSSTSAFMAHILIEAGLDPTVLIGAPVIAWDRKGARAGKGKYMVVEADEYRNHFLHLHPAIEIITTIDFDHPDFFHSLEDVEASYQQFIAGREKDGKVVVLESEYVKRADGFWPEDTIQVKDADKDECVVPIPGDHMRRNAALAVTAAGQLGVQREVALAALTTFGGLGRRFEKLGELLGKPVYSDYGHHPAEIAATIQGIRQQFQNQKLLVIFEAHMIERVHAFFPDFIEALSLADGVIICPVFYPKGREGEREQAEEKIRGALPIPNVVIPSFDDLGGAVHSMLPIFDIACAFTAGVLDGKLRQVVKNQ